MAAQARGLGKGLGALIPTEPTKLKTSITPSPLETPVTYLELPVDSVLPNPAQPRSVFDEEALAELVFSIKTIGLLQPIVVRKSGSGSYELIAGERRLRASKLAGVTAIPAIIRNTEDSNMLRDALLENLHRSNLNALEEAAAYSQMLSDFDCTQDELAQRIGRSRPQVTNTIRLLKLPTPVQQKVAAGVISAGHARALLALGSPEEMEHMANRIIKEGLSVRSVEEIIAVTAPSKKSSGKSGKKKGRSEDLEEAIRVLTERMGDATDTRVKLEGFAKKNSQGKIVIECADLSDARRITELLDKSGH
ncbi:MAG: ParB/RepB/Spo0J family partition protein [Actinomycetia bacterium]|jgi:ParB family transcriptional regulator, chromosome partitioning protein|nr:ParB/RepB/Spo0J family partition protein [Actinomycetes bacterium]MCH9839589.1 ParB/RepB/Spo0J family partition protein [Actinomycetes bacterium]